jgi:hypothetical protein
MAHGARPALPVSAQMRYLHPMSTDPKDMPRQSEAERRAARLAEELRANLQRRKQQIRARRAGAAETGEGLPAAEPRPRSGEE